MKDAIVVAGGDSARRFQLTSNLGSEQFKVTICQSPVDFTKTTGEENINVILLLYPDESGLIDWLFQSEIMTGVIGRIPVVFISSSPAENSRARSLRHKADEFLIEPITPLEIVRLASSSFGFSAENDNHDTLTIGDLVLDKTSLAVTLRKVKLPLYPIQVRILELLMRSPGHAFTRQENIKEYMELRPIYR